MIRIGRAKIARNAGELIVGVILLILMAGLTMIAIDDRCSRALDNVDLVWDEIDPAIRQAALKR